MKPIEPESKVTKETENYIHGKDMCVAAAKAGDSQSIIGAGVSREGCCNGVSLSRHKCMHQT